MSRRSSPRGRDNRNVWDRDGSNSRRDRRGRRRHDNDDKRRRDQSPRDGSINLPDSPRRSERRRSRHSLSPRRNFSSHDRSLSPSRYDKRYIDRNPSQKRRSRRRSTKHRSRSPKSRGRRGKRSRRKRHHRHHGSISSSPSESRPRGHDHTHSRRHSDYHNSSSSSSESVVYRKVRNHHKRKNGHVEFFRVGDKVNMKLHNDHSRRGRWVSAVVIDVQNLYGEFIYSVSLDHSGRILDSVRADELRFKHHKKYELADISRCREDLRQINLSLGHQESGRVFPDRERSVYPFIIGGQRTRGAARAREPRARSVDGNGFISDRHVHKECRSLSIPPQNYSIPEFLAKFYMATISGDIGPNQLPNDDNEFKGHDSDHEGEILHGRNVRPVQKDGFDVIKHNQWRNKGTEIFDNDQIHKSNNHRCNNLADHLDLETDCVERMPLSMSGRRVSQKDLKRMPLSMSGRRVSQKDLKRVQNGDFIINVQLRPSGST